jgi:hypothetical protein
MNAIKTFFKQFLKVIADSRQESVAKTAQYFVWHGVVILAINIVCFVIGLATSLEFYGWILFCTLGLISASVIGIGYTLTVGNQESYLDYLKTGNAFKNRLNHSFYYFLGFFISLFIFTFPLGFSTQGNPHPPATLSGAFSFLIGSYAILLSTAFISQVIRIKLIPFVNKKVNKAFKE